MGEDKEYYIDDLMLIKFLNSLEKERASTS